MFLSIKNVSKKEVSSNYVNSTTDAPDGWLNLARGEDELRTNCDTNMNVMKIKL